MGTLRWAAIIFGVLFIVGFVAVFIPALMMNGRLLGLLHIEPLHNYIHLISGIFALFAATKVNYARLYFQVLGIFYAFVTIIGFVHNSNFFGLMRMNMPDNLLHLVIAVVALYFGFLFKMAEQ